MVIEAWDSLDEVAQAIIKMGAVAAAVTAITVIYRSIAPKVRAVREMVKWIMSDESDHKIIIGMIEDIKHMVSPDDGTSIPDALSRIEHSVMFQGARQQATLHMNGSPVFESDETGKVTFVNAAYKRFFGVAGQNALGMGWVNVIDPGERGEVVQKWFSAVREKRTFDEYMTLSTAEGDPIRAHVIAYVIRADGSDLLLGHHGEVTFLDQSA